MLICRRWANRQFRLIISYFLIIIYLHIFFMNSTEQINFQNENEENEKEKLLSSLPEGLKERWEDASLKDIQKVLETRRTLGYEIIKGYHVSDVDLPTGSYLIPGPNAEGKLFYSEDIKNLCGR